MARSLQARSRFLALVGATALLATMAVMATARAPITLAVVEPCTGASEIIDLGDHYLVKGTKGNDVIDCTESDKPVEIRGGFGIDFLYGSDYDDVLKGGFGDDNLWGFSGNDLLQGGWGDDDLNGGPDTDVCLGGWGTDLIVACETAEQGKP